VVTSSFRQLEVWKAAHGLVLDVYRLTSIFPNEEKFGLVSQMRRASVSVPANIAEGYKRRGLKEKIRYLQYRGSFTGRAAVLFFVM